jgi:hypothetical protein
VVYDWYIIFMDEILEFIKSVEEVFTVQAKAIKINDEVVLHEGKFQQEREGLEL